MSQRKVRVVAVAPLFGSLLALSACTTGPGSVGNYSGGTGGDDGGTESDTGSADGISSSASASSGDTADTGGLKLDVAPGETTGPGGSSCEVDPEGLDGSPPCEVEAPPDSFDPEVQWGWTGPGDLTWVRVTPAVANLTDDNDDGQIDLCDTPDVIALAGSGSEGKLFALDGQTGQEHWATQELLRDETHPAVGDIDGDGLPEIVAMRLDTHLMAFEHDGTLKWTSADTWNWGESNSSALALADLDNDGDVEIIGGHFVFDHEGNLEFQAPFLGAATAYSASTAADLDGDGDLEVLVGAAAYHHDGSAYFASGELGGDDCAYPQVANLDDDDDPEILLMNCWGSQIIVLEHDGTTKFNKSGGSGAAVTIHDFDGDNQVEFATSVGDTLTMFERDATISWQMPKPGGSWSSSGTGFDFLGDGSSEVITGDASVVQVFDGADGSVLFEIPRSSGTGLDYEVVADVDNDGSAEMVIQSSSVPGVEMTAPSIQVIRDQQDRWVPARRIWNQHTYHVTNVREDGTIPQFEPPHWKSVNTFRTQAQVEAGSVCKPEPEG